MQVVIQQQLDSGIVPTFYSDGSCLNPELPEASLASWGLILSLDLDLTDGARKQTLLNCNTVEAVAKHFVVVATDRCHGQQSIDRAELQAMVFLHERVTATILVTDNQYSIDCWKKVTETTDIGSLDFLANSDLLRRLRQANLQSQHTVRKVKSHQRDFGSTEECPCYDTLGNELWWTKWQKRRMFR